MSVLLECLRSFNRKERFFLIGAALGNPGFRSSVEFRHRLRAVFDLRVPEDAFVAMDFHLDWLHAALVLANGAGADGIHANDGNVTGNQEDVDLLVAFDAGATSHLMLLEAKAETGWTNEQMHSKARRLAAIFGQDGKRYSFAVPHFALTSPRPPQQLESDSWPVWMTREGTPLWLELAIPDGLRRVERCDAGGRPDAAGSHFRVVSQQRRVSRGGAA